MMQHTKRGLLGVLFCAGVAVLYQFHVPKASPQSKNPFTALEQARDLQPPQVSSTQGGEMDDLEFWETHESLIRQAWREWSHTADLPSLDETTLIHNEFQKRMSHLCQSQTASLVDFSSSLFEERVPGVWVADSFLSLSGVKALRHHLQKVQTSGIPTRRPNGMNRYGVVLDPSGETQGAVQYAQVDHFHTWLVDHYVRPLGRLLFPEFIREGDDASSYAFTIQYAAQKRDRSGDLKLEEHSDASVVTMNINLNLPSDGSIEGSSLVFQDPDPATKKRHYLNMTTPGMAVIHRGFQRHQALPILSGQRAQLIIWLFAENGYVRIAPYDDTDHPTTFLDKRTELWPCSNTQY